jgi:hypothetical protein
MSEEGRRAKVPAVEAMAPRTPWNKVRRAVPPALPVLLVLPLLSKRSRRTED